MSISKRLETETVELNDNTFEVSTQFGYFVAVKCLDNGEEIVYQNIHDELTGSPEAARILEEEGAEEFVSHLVEDWGLLV